MLFLLIRRGLRQHLVSTAVAVLLVALGMGLVVSVWVVRAEAEQSFTRSASGFDAVLGARGSKLQLVLNGLFHQEASPGNITAEDYQQVKALPMVDRAIPIVVGDNFRGVRLVGVSDDFFQNLEYAPDHVYTVEPGGPAIPGGPERGCGGQPGGAPAGLVHRHDLPPVPRPGLQSRRPAQRDLHGGGGARPHQHPGRPGHLGAPGGRPEAGRPRPGRLHRAQRRAHPVQARGQGGRAHAGHPLQPPGQAADPGLAGGVDPGRPVRQVLLVRDRPAGPGLHGGGGGRGLGVLLGLLLHERAQARPGHPARPGRAPRLPDRGRAGRIGRHRTARLRPGVRPVCGHRLDRAGDPADPDRRPARALGLEPGAWSGAPC